MEEGSISDESPRLSGSYAKTAYAVQINVSRMILEDGLERTGFLTLTVGDQNPVYGFEQVWDAKEASRRFNSLRTNLLVDLFDRAVVVTERHKSGAIHFHLVGSLKGVQDIRTGFDHKAVSDGDYRSASSQLRDIWTLLRERLPEFGFGRAELTPIRTTGEQIGSYVSKYISKNLENRRPEDRHKKLVRYLGWEGEQLKPENFGWATLGARQWRSKAREAASVMGCYCPEDCYKLFGPKWAFILTETWTRICDGKGSFHLNKLFPRYHILWETLIMRLDRETRDNFLEGGQRRRRQERAEIQDTIEFYSKRGTPVGWGVAYRVPSLEFDCRKQGCRMADDDAIRSESG